MTLKLAKLLRGFLVPTCVQRPEALGRIESLLALLCVRGRKPLEGLSVVPDVFDNTSVGVPKNVKSIETQNGSVPDVVDSTPVDVPKNVKSIGTQNGRLKT